jgi:predicted RNase H-like HicB family nuclease
MGLLSQFVGGGGALATYAVPVKISRQEDGLWRVECPAFQGCFVDDADLSRALAEVQEVIKMYIDLYRQRARELPAEIDPDALILTLIPVAA